MIYRCKRSDVKGIKMGVRSARIIETLGKGKWERDEGRLLVMADGGGSNG